MIKIEEIITRAKTYLPLLNGERVCRAYDFAEEAHRGQTRFSGEPYIIHPLAVANILLDFHPDEDTLVAALLHDVAEDTTRTLSEIEAAFGPKVHDLCRGLMKLSKVKSKLNDPQVENLRKLFLAMAKDFRVVLIKLCDRLHNMQTFKFVRPEKRTRIAQETLNIYAPIAARLGIYRLKSQLEDLCFEYLNPQEYQSIQSQLVKTAKWREKFIDTAKKTLNEVLLDDGIQTEIDGRVKSLYSIFRKLQKKNKLSVDEVFDVFAMRIIIPDVYKYEKEYTGHLYTALGIIHNTFTPLANRFKDYVAVPKVNGYRSLHTTVMGLGPKEYTQPTEIQIRTRSMHEAAEFGIAAHWVYKEISSMPGSLLKQHQEWISGLGKIEKEITSNQELLENLRVDVFQDRIFVLTPRGDVRDLPAQATPIDFAYSVHTEIGNHCIGAKVNGSIVPVDYELKSGEVVEVITRKNAQPSHHWLSFVKTNHAKNRIRNWFRNLNEEKHLKVGRELLNEKLQQLGRPPLDDSLSLLRSYDGKHASLDQRRQILVEIGKGVAFASTVLKKIFTLEELLGNRTAQGLATRPSRLPTGQAGSKKEEKLGKSIEKPHIIIGDEKNLPYHFVKCCSAVFGDDLIGYTTRGRGVSVHRKDCKVVAQAENVRLIAVNVRKSQTRYPVRLKLIADDRIGLMRDISHEIAKNSLNIIDIREQSAKGGVELYLLIEIEHFDQLDRLLSKFEKIPSVRRAFKVS